jgi:hypothetical protein
MRWSWRIGSIAGIGVNMQATFLLLILFILSLYLQQASTTFGAGPLSGWGYRQAISISSPTAVANQPVLVTLIPDPAMNPKGSDLRFTAADGKTLLDYWIESWGGRGDSRIWVKVPEPGTRALYIYYGNPAALAVSDGEKTFDFFDDFNDGIWTKYPGNPLNFTFGSAEGTGEPSLTYENDLFKLWYPGSHGLDYATSKDGFTWTTYGRNPVLPDESEAGRRINRAFVMKHGDTYYLFGVKRENANSVPDNIMPTVPSELWRWTSKDGIHWSDDRIVMTADQPWERLSLSNVSVLVDPDGTWKMLYTQAAGGDDCFGLAVSQDGIRWTKYEGNPVMKGFYGGDPFVARIGDTYYVWHSQAYETGLLISAASSKDMIHWTPIYNNPQINYTQGWEHGTIQSYPDYRIGTRHLTDVHMCEAKGKVFMIYIGAQKPMGIVTFDGTFTQLGARLEKPPLRKWAEVPYKSVENKELKMSDDASNADPFYENSARFSDAAGYVLEFRARCYRGAYLGHRVQVLARFIDKDNFARFWIYDNATTYYQERVGGQLERGINIGENRICDEKWHTWTVGVDGRENRLYIDGRYVGKAESSSAFTGRSDLLIGFSVYGTYAAFDDVRVRKNDPRRPVASLSGRPERLVPFPTRRP